MVSLINFKIVNEDLDSESMRVQGQVNFGIQPQQPQLQAQAEQQQQQAIQGAKANENVIELQINGRKQSSEFRADEAGTGNENSRIDEFLVANGNIHQVDYCKSQVNQSSVNCRQDNCQAITDHSSSSSTTSSSFKPTISIYNSSKQSSQSNKNHQHHHNHHHHHDQLDLFNKDSGKDGTSCHATRQSQFVVTWRKLRYVIEPKWHERFLSSLQGTCSRKKATQQQALEDVATPEDGNNLASLPGEPREPRPIQSGHSQPATKIVLDELDGSFRSGELTAILGPSGAGKTTLLDCLTGHKRNGLSGSIRISGGPVASQLDDGQASRDRNLRVSIIPQNDHLMGHLTVYETLNYASKMKNCYANNFNHKANIKRIAQQLGLTSCLGNRINKLSGGQYKRVSIAQELLSSPDVLILDEPTSGLDAMTCYQTVQVLRKLTEPAVDGTGSRQGHMAVILTIHQPNSDVFQQFNHVYVVAQGGKCIFEGPPASIDSAINRIGIQLPSRSYNPATLIVEVAASKFGPEAIDKLNAIQRKSYEFQATSSSDEQTSTGDSAVECPSSTSSSFSFGNETDSDDDVDQRNKSQPKLVVGADKDDNNNNKNNNNIQQLVDSTGNGIINPGFVDDKQQLDENCTSKSIVLNLPSDYHSLDKLKNLAKRQAQRSERKCRQKRATSQEADGPINEKSSTNLATYDHQPSVILLNGPRDHLALAGHQDIRLHPFEGMGKGKPDQPDGLNLQVANLRSNRLEVSMVNKFDGLDELRADRKKFKRKLNGTGNNNNRLVDDEHGTAGNKKNGHYNDNSNDNQNHNHNNDHNGISNSNSNSNQKRLKLNSLKAGQNFPFWRHTYLHFHRSWLSIVRDPMLCGMQLTLHILVPVMVSLVYGSHVGVPNACPRAGPVDIMAYALEPQDAALQLQEDLRTTLENIGYIFFKLYGIIFAAMTVTVLTFPLDMHVLVKEFRNGWYGLSSYFIGRTLADVPFQLTLPFLAMSLSYYATGQPYSYMQWRFLSITGILILSSLIAQSQGLLFGAILMDKMKAAVFVAPAATTPIILFAGFLVRTQSIPRYLRPLSNLSYLRYAIEACLISRYGFNQCQCDPAIFNQTVPELPPMARSMLDYWLSSFKPQPNDDLVSLNGSITTTTTMAPVRENPDLFAKLMDSLARANSFGRNITSCEQVVPYPMIDYDLKDSQLFNCFAILTTMLVVTRLLTFFIVSFKVKRKV